MCGIVGLLVKTPALRDRLGELMVPMLIGMTERGPDSAGLAVFGDAVEPNQRKLSLYSGFTDEGEHFPWDVLLDRLKASVDTGARVDAKGNHAVLTVHAQADTVRHWLNEHYPRVYLLSAGRSIDLYRTSACPPTSPRVTRSVASRALTVGHTRMATESAVTPDRAHPFTAGEDFCPSTTARCRTLTACAESWSRRAFISIPTTTPRLRAASSNGDCARATRCRWHCRRASRSSTASTRS